MKLWQPAHIVYRMQQNTADNGMPFWNDHPIHIEIGMGKADFWWILLRYIPKSIISALSVTPVYCCAQSRKWIPCSFQMFISVWRRRKTSGNFCTGRSWPDLSEFSDPWPKDRHARRRLTSHEFLDRYDQFLAADGRLEFKTDNQDLFTFSLEEIETSDRWHLNASTRDLHHDPSMNEGNIMTEYEEKFSSKGNPICKLIASR